MDDVFKMNKQWISFWSPSKFKDAFSYFVTFCFTLSRTYRKPYDMYSNKVLESPYMV